MKTRALGIVASGRKRNYVAEAPFGEELSAGVGIRSEALGYGADSTRQKFGSHERDNETGLDFMQARYFASVQGRFTSVDPGPFVIADPQSWNRYSYVLNNPLKFIDPTGRELYLTGDEANAFLEYLKQKSGYNLSLNKDGKVKIEKGKRNEQGTSKEFADTLKDAIKASEKASFIVTKDDPPENFVDNTLDAARTGATPKVDMNDIRDLDRQAPELGVALVGHFLQERLAIAQGIDGVDSEIPGRGMVKGAHTRGLEVESKILSGFTGQKEQLRREIDRNPTFSFVYTSVRYDVTLKATGTNNVTSVDKVAKGKP